MVKNLYDYGLSLENLYGRNTIGNTGHYAWPTMKILRVLAFPVGECGCSKLVGGQSYVTPFTPGREERG
jgi:hypothetical protein